jgi:hypothetical protein
MTARLLRYNQMLSTPSDTGLNFRLSC